MRVRSGTLALEFACVALVAAAVAPSVAFGGSAFVTSTSEEGTSRVRLEFARGTNIDEAANDLRAALDDLRTEFPIEADPPRIFKLDLDQVDVVSLVATSTCCCLRSGTKRPSPPAPR